MNKLQYIQLTKLKWMNLSSFLNMKGSQKPRIKTKKSRLQKDGNTCKTYTLR